MESRAISHWHKEKNRCQSSASGGGWSSIPLFPPLQPHCPLTHSSPVASSPLCPMSSRVDIPVTVCFFCFVFLNGWMAAWIFNARASVSDVYGLIWPPTGDLETIPLWIIHACLWFYGRYQHSFIQKKTNQKNAYMGNKNKIRSDCKYHLHKAKTEWHSLIH